MKLVDSIEQIKPGMLLVHGEPRVRWIGYIDENGEAYCLRTVDGDWRAKLFYTISSPAKWRLETNPLYALEEGDPEYDECCVVIAKAALGVT